MINCKELAESYINGNISSVRAKLYHESKAALITAKIIFELYGEKEFLTFVRLMTQI